MRVHGELERIFPEHYENLSRHRERGIPLSPNHQAYREKERFGELLLVTLREGGEMAGYCTVLVGRSMHYETITAVPDLLYIRESTRKTRFAVYRRLLRATEKELRARGVECWFSGTKVHRNAARLLRAMGFEAVEEMLCKWLD